jgi:AraC family transcriptional regulator
LKAASLDPRAFASLPRIIDSSISATAADFEPPTPDLDLGHAKISVIPNGGIEFNHFGNRHLIDLHGDATIHGIAINSDRFSYFHPPPDSVGFIPSGCSLKLDVVNIRPTIGIFLDSNWITEISRDALAADTRASMPLAYHYDSHIHYLKNLIAGIVGSETPDKLAAESAVADICIRLLEITSGRCLPGRASNRLHDSIFRAIDHAEAQLAGDVSIASLAREAGLSQFHFIRIFREVAGETPLAYVRRRRLERAMESLRLTNQPIAQIAAACGFSHQSHLTERMRLEHGTTPADYRKTFD